MAVAQRMTAEQFMKAFPEDSHPRVQLVAGEVVVSQPGFLHQDVPVRLLVALRNWAAGGRERGVAITPLDVLLDDENMYAPDVLWYRPERAPSPEERPPYSVPDLAVEVRSPSTWRYDVGVKRQVYEAQGLAELWLVDTESQSASSAARRRPSRRSTSASSSTARRRWPRRCCPAVTYPRFIGATVVLLLLVAAPAAANLRDSRGNFVFGGSTTRSAPSRIPRWAST